MELILDFVVVFLTLAFLEIVLGVDNIIFISIVTNKLPKEQQAKGRLVGLLLALVFRITLLITIIWILHHLTTPFFPMDGYTVEQVMEMMHSEPHILKKVQYLFHTISVREVILFIGGLFLLGKSVSEIHHKMEGQAKEHKHKKNVSFGKIIMQIVLLDIVFSFDSILTAIGMTDNLWAMILAVVVAVIVMIIFSGKISKFISSHPTLEILALSFLILIGFMLVVESVHIEVPKGYIYFAVFFSLIIEIINIKMRKRRDKKSDNVQLKRKIKDEVK